jgi:hypothetical protein
LFVARGNILGGEGRAKFYGDEQGEYLICDKGYRWLQGIGEKASECECFAGIASDRGAVR